MDFGFSIGIFGVGALIVGALVAGGIGQIVGDAATSYEWAITAVAAFVFGFVASEFVVTWRAWEPIFDGLALAPALVGGLVAGFLVAVSTRLLTGGTYLSAEAR